MTARSMTIRAAKDIGLGEPNYLQRRYQRRNGSAFAGNWPWCDGAITIWSIDSDNHDVVCPRGDRAYTVWHAQDGQQLGRWHAGTSANIRRYCPKGSIVFMDWGGSNTIGRIDHVGVCDRNLGDGRVVTIEGNTSDRCARRVRGAEVIAGFWTPDYSGTGDKVTGGRDRLLRRGDRGPAVRELQRTLNEHNYELTVDGVYGPRTEAAVRAYQRENGLEVDGVAGPETMGHLQEEDVAAEDVWTHEWPYHGRDPIQASTYLSRTYVHALQAHQLLKAIGEKLDVPVKVDVDEAALAQEILAALPADLAQQIAREALDEAAARLAG